MSIVIIEAATEFSVKENDDLNEMASKMKSPQFVASMLNQVGINDLEEARQFFLPSLSHTIDPFLMKDMKAAVDLVQGIVARNEKVVIHGDYDVDGISGTALLYLGLKEIGVQNLDWFLPNRFIQGYGLCKETIKTFAERGFEWIITVDTGITAVEEIAYANSLGLKVIVMDHHQVGDALPKAEAILNPMQKDCPYPNKSLCGVGVAFKFLVAYHGGNTQTVAHYLDLFTLGTLADMMLVTGENRIYLRHGLQIAIRGQRPGLKALFQAAKIERSVLRAQDVLFRATPMINAVGRLGDPSLAMELLISTSEKQARECVEKMGIANIERREIEAQLSRDAVKQVETSKILETDQIIVVASKGWHQGVVGIVAARLVEKYNKPAAVISIDEFGEGRASARSVEGFNWHKALGECQDLLPRWGGHYFAAGFNIDEKDIPDFRRRLNEIAKRISFEPEQVKSVKATQNITFTDLNEANMQWLQRFEPHGPGNVSPLFFSENVFVDGECRVVGEKHLKIRVRQEKRVLEGIAFGLGPWAEKLQEYEGPIKVTFHPIWNIFRNRKSLQLQITAIELQK